MGSFIDSSNRLALWAGAFVLANVVTAGGCGGKAVVDPGVTGTGGGSSTSSGTGGTTSSTSTSTTSTSGTGGGPGSLCMEACSKIDGCLTMGADCTDSCQQAMDSCLPQQDDYLMCVIDAPMEPGCGVVPDCNSDLLAFRDCKNIHELSGGCGMDPNGGCDCQVDDNQGNLYESYCASSEGQNKCECFFNYEPVGQCSFTGIENCFPLDNCCASLFFVPALPG